MTKKQEAVFSDMVILDMKTKIDPSQYGNQRRTSIHHYFVKIMDKLLTNVHKNSKGEIIADLAMFVD